VVGGGAAFTPLSISGLQLWIKADAGTWQDSVGSTPAVADADVVGAWADQSGSGNNVTQATADKKPLLKLNIQNGLPVIRFDVTNDYLQGTALTAFDGTAYTVFWVAKQNNPNGLGTVINTGDGPSKDKRFVAYEDTRTNKILTVVKTDSAAYQVDLDSRKSNTYYINAARRSGATFAGYLNGTQQADVETIAGTMTDNDVLRVGAQHGPQTYLNGDICEVVIYNSALSATDMNRVGNYLERWGLAWTDLNP
jgi:hypothetical protein